MLLEFTIWTDSHDQNRIYINPKEVVSVEEYEMRSSYSGWNPVSRIVMKTGSNYVVDGHVSKRIIESSSRGTSP